MWKWLVTWPLFTPIWNPQFDPNDIADAMLAMNGLTTGNTGAAAKAMINEQIYEDIAWL